MSNQTEELSKSLTPVGRAGSSTPQLVKDITPGKQSSTFSYLTSSNDTVYFSLVKDNNKTGSSTFELWKSDGTGKGTNILKNLGAFQLENLYSGLDPDTFYFTTVKDDGNYETLDPKQLWKTDGTTKGTQQLKNFGAFQLDNFYSGLDPDTLYFTTVKDDGNYKQLWKTDGTTKGTQLVKEFGNSGYFTLTNFKDKIYFPINQENKNQLWKTDGTTKGTQLVKNFGGFEVESLYSWLDPDTLYFTTVKDDGTYGTPDPKQLWKTDGTTKGTQLVKELGNSNDYPHLTNFKDKIYFTLNQENKNQLWKTDGTTKGTQLVKNFGGFEVESLYSWLDPDTLYFTTVKDDGTYGTPDPKQLWKTDGTTKGTQLVKELGNSDGYYYDLKNFKDKIYFTVNQENKNQLWKTDGTTKGTQQLKNFGAFEVDNFYSGLDPDTLYFTTVKDDGNYETPDPYQLWKTDGTTKGTQLVQDLGEMSSFQQTSIGSDLYYTAKDAAHGLELWKLEGSNDPLTLSAKEDVLLNSGNSNASALSSQDDSMLMYQMGMNPALLPLEKSSLAASGMGQSSLLMGKQQGLGFTQENTLFPLPETSQII
jgi:ELWxxDGT repeat protein